MYNLKSFFYQLDFLCCNLDFDWLFLVLSEGHAVDIENLLNDKYIKQN